MSSLTVSRLLNVWEQGAGLLPVQRAIALLAAAFSDEAVDCLVDLNISERDARLLRLREALFGAQINSLADCPSCGERVEMALRVEDLLSVQGQTANEDGYTLEQDGFRLRFRLPASRDLLAMASSQAPDRRRELAERCILEAVQADQAVALVELPDAILEAMNRQMADAAPLADIWFTLACPACGHAWQAPFDIVTYLWSEIDAWAYRTLQEVHCLARAYGWSEAEILGLSAWRRQYYLSLI